jgi:acyl-coenzyme A synthetase/AMP-(fatty) acid ligase
MKRLPHVQFTNLYGPTETTIASSYYTVPECPRDERQPIPIGRACAGEELLVLDAEQQPVPVGSVGDLYIAGAGVSPGYWADPDKTRAAFVRRPGSGAGERMYRTGDRAHRDEEGRHYFHGRADTQIKCRGYRIELGEIEAALHTLPALRESAVVAIESDGFEGSTVCCAYVPAQHVDVSTLDLRKALAAQVPAHMLPTRWRSYESLPTNASGKYDRLKLTDDFRQTQSAPVASASARPPASFARTGRDTIGGVEA